MNMEEAIEALHERLSRLEAESAMGLTVLSALIRVAPNPTDLHLAMTLSFESAAGQRAGPFQRLEDDQIRYARDLLEHLGTIATRFPRPLGEGESEPNSA